MVDLLFASRNEGKWLELKDEFAKHRSKFSFR